MSYSIQDVANIAESEGLGYALVHYFDPEDIEDPELRQYAVAARYNLEAVEEIIEPYMP